MKVEIKTFSNIWRPTKKAEEQYLIAFFGFSRYVYHLGKLLWFICWVPMKTVNFEGSPEKKWIQNNAGPGFGANCPAHKQLSPKTQQTLGLFACLWGECCAGSLLLHAGLFLLWSTGSKVWGFQSLWHVGSAVVLHRLSCPTACGLLQDQGSNLGPLHWQVDS